MSKVSKSLLISLRPGHLRVALIEESRVVEYQTESLSDARSLGSIYRGKIDRIVKSLEAAFVDIGEDKNGFLPLTDFNVAQTSGRKGALNENCRESSIAQSSNLQPKSESKKFKNSDIVLVQAIKDPHKSKGIKLTTDIAIPGRFLVYRKNGSRISVSKKISDRTEIDRIRQILNSIRPKKGSIIARTSCFGATHDELKSDLEEILRIANEIEVRFSMSNEVERLHQDVDLLEAILRDRVGTNIDRVLVDDKQIFSRVKDWINVYLPQVEIDLILYTEAKPLLTLYSVEEQVASSYHKKISVNDGAEIVIEQTEALTAIDVNSGSFIGLGSSSESILDINKMCAKEIAIQLRLRNISGIVVVDFIDMRSSVDRRKILDAFSLALSSDRAKIRVLPINEFGLLHLTRERARDSLEGKNTTSCYLCAGSGREINENIVVQRLLSDLEQFKLQHPNRKKITIQSSEGIIKLLKGTERDWFQQILDSWSAEVVCESLDAESLKKLNFYKLV